MATEFEPQVVPRQNNQLMLVLWQHPNKSTKEERQEGPESVERIWGLPFRAASEGMLWLVQEAGHAIGAFGPTEGEPVMLPEDVGVRLSVLAMALKPLPKLERIREIEEGVAEMRREEVTYWFSKAFGTPTYNDRRRILKAMRILLAKQQKPAGPMVN